MGFGLTIGGPPRPQRLETKDTSRTSFEIPMGSSPTLPSSARSKILNHLGLPTHPPPLSPARLPQQHEFDLVDDLPPDDDYLDIPTRSHTPLIASRASPP